MRAVIVLVVATFVSALAVEGFAQTLPAPKAISDAKQISSKPSAQV